MKTDKLLLVRPILVIFSLFGIVLAKGWASTIAAIFFPLGLGIWRLNTSLAY